LACREVLRPESAHGTAFEIPAALATVEKADVDRTTHKKISPAGFLNIVSPIVS
jgi:hypothetical protein